MSLGDRLSLEGMALLVVLVAIVLFLLRNKRPHYEWLEYLVHKPLGPRQRVVLVISLLVGMFVVLSVALRTCTGAPEM